MAQTDAQRAASERNLKKGNPAAFTKPKPAKAAAPPKRTYRAKPPAKSPSKAPDPSPDPTPAVPARASAEERKGGFLDDVFGKIFG